EAQLRSPVALRARLECLSAVDPFEQFLMCRKDLFLLCRGPVDGAGHRTRGRAVADQPPEIVVEFSSPLVWQLDRAGVVTLGGVRRSIGRDGQAVVGHGRRSR